MKNIFLWGWTEPDQLAAIEILRRNHGIKIVDWVGDLSGLEKSYVNFIYNQPEFLPISVPRCCNGLTADELAKFMDMFSREKRAKGMDYHEQINIAKNYFRYFVSLLQDRQVTNVLFSMFPIIGFDYLCYLAAKRLKLDVVMCYQSIFPDRFFYCHDIEDFGRFDDIKFSSDVDAPEIEWGFKKDLFYMKGSIRMSREVKPIYRLIRETLRYGIRKSSKPMRYSGVVENFLHASDYREQYVKNAKVESDLDLSTNFVYFPLHLQPELTTSGMGGAFSDQLDAIERLSEMLPYGWKIYAKENPKQGHEQRGQEFFTRIKTFKNVVYLSKEVSTYKLMEHCRFVATITGTAGWECVTGGKPCLVFGLAWYLNMPGVTFYTSEIELKDILDVRIDRREQISTFSNLYRKTLPGVMDKVYAVIVPTYSSEGNVKKISEFLNKILMIS